RRGLEVILDVPISRIPLTKCKQVSSRIRSLNGFDTPLAVHILFVLPDHSISSTCLDNQTINSAAGESLIAEYGGHSQRSEGFHGSTNPFLKKNGA
ncbi:MAG: hypothetical protein ACKPKO_57800, partial [Candidatus Fonsibacter sp.]